MQKLLNTLFGLLAEFFQLFKDLEEAEGRAGATRVAAMATPGVTGVAGGGENREAKMNIFGGISTLLLLLSEAAKASAFTPMQRGGIAERLQSFRAECPADAEVQAALEEAITAVTE